MLKSSSLAESANLESVRRWRVDDFCRLCKTGFSRWVDTGRDEWSRAGARTESAREMARDSGRGLKVGEVGELGPSNGCCRMFSTLCDRVCETDRMGLPDELDGRFFSGEGGGEFCGACERGRSALRMLAYVLLGFVSSEPPK